MAGNMERLMKLAYTELYHNRAKFLKKKGD